jgi:hypothetical protein
MSKEWTALTDHDTAVRRAAGRRRHNANRQAKALKRYKIVLDVFTRSGEELKRGDAARLARTLGVHPSTISRDRAKATRLMFEAVDGMRELKRQRRAPDDRTDVAFSLFKSPFTASDF